MKFPVAISALAVAAMAFVLPATAQGPAGANAENSKQPVQHHPVPRAADGKPDMSGTWQAGGVSINGEPGAPPLHPLPPIDKHTIARQPLAYKPDWEARRKPLTVLDDPTLQCLLPGVPRIQTEPMPLEIVQTPKEVVILYESFRAWRRIPINNKLEHDPDITPTWMGDSVGRWEGDTFVVDVTGFNEKTWISGTGTIHSDKMHVVERYTLNNDGSLTWEARVEDPGALTKPYLTGAVFRQPVDVHVEEYECLENNPDPGHMKKAAEIEHSGQK